MSVLYDLGLAVKFYSEETLNPYSRKQDIRDLYGKDAEKILKFIDLPIGNAAKKKILDLNLFENRKLSLKEIDDHLRKGDVPIVLIDNNKISNIEGLYQGHFVVITGFDDEHTYYHDSDSIPNKKVKKELFIKAMNANGTDNDCIMVFGKMNN